DRAAAPAGAPGPPTPVSRGPDPARDRRPDRDLADAGVADAERCAAEAPRRRRRRRGAAGAGLAASGLARPAAPAPAARGPGRAASPLLALARAVGRSVRILAAPGPLAAVAATLIPSRRGLGTGSL